jgi:uncharacterized metal-binding protein (TIGR02443 family)
MTGLRRFIAGATCPACGRIDKLFVRSEEGLRVCECVACGHRETLDPGGEVLREAPSSAEVQPVRLVDP